MAQTSFWAEMPKKGMVVPSAFPRSARRGRRETNGWKTQYKRNNELVDDAPDDGKELPDLNPKELER